jgi:hypothetical protein
VNTFLSLLLFLFPTSGVHFKLVKEPSLGTRLQPPVHDHNTNLLHAYLDIFPVMSSADSATVTDVESTPDQIPMTSTTAPADASGSTEAATHAPSSANAAPLSKSQQKKAAKAARFAEYKIERRAREKEAKKRKKQERAQKRAAGELHSGEDDDEDEQDRKKKKAKRGQPFGATVVVDLGFDDKMTDKVCMCAYDVFFSMIIFIA